MVQMSIRSRGSRAALPVTLLAVLLVVASPTCAAARALTTETLPKLYLVDLAWDSSGGNTSIVDRVWSLDLSCPTSSSCLKVVVSGAASPTRAQAGVFPYGPYGARMVLWTDPPEGNMLVLSQNSFLPLGGYIMRYQQPTYPATTWPAITTLPTDCTALTCAYNIVNSSSLGAGTDAAREFIINAGRLFVVDLGDAFTTTNTTTNITTTVDVAGALRQYNATSGRLFRRLNMTGLGFPFHPTSLVLGPDGNLWIAARQLNPNNPFSQEGYILRVNPDVTGTKPALLNPGGVWANSVTSTNDCVRAMARPDSIRWVPDAKRFVVTAFRVVPATTPGNLYVDNSPDKVIVFTTDPNNKYAFVSCSVVILDDGSKVNPTNITQRLRQAAQKVIFGPDRKMYVPINVGNTKTELRAYTYSDADGYATKRYDVVANLDSVKQAWNLGFEATSTDSLWYCGSTTDCPF